MPLRTDQRRLRWWQSPLGLHRAGGQPAPAPLDKREAGSELYRQFVARNPRTCSFGILLEDMAMGAYAMHSVLWFKSSDECAEFLETYWDPLFGEIDEADLEDFETVAEEIRQSGLTEDALRVLSRGYQKFIWSGAFAELCAGEKEIPRQSVAKFRGRPKETIKPIGPKDVERFIGFLREIRDNY